MVHKYSDELESSNPEVGVDADITVIESGIN